MLVHRVGVLPSLTVAHSLEILPVAFVVMLARSRNSAGDALVDERLFRVMAKAIASSFLDIVLKAAFLAIVIG